MAFQFLLVRIQLIYLLSQLLVSQAQSVDLLSEFLLHVDKLLSQLFQIGILSLELRLSLLCDLLLNTNDFLENVDILLECACDLLVLLELVSQEDLHVSQSFKLCLIVFSILASTSFHRSRNHRVVG